MSRSNARKPVSRLLAKHADVGLAVRVGDAAYLLAAPDDTVESLERDHPRKTILFWGRSPALDRFTWLNVLRVEKVSEIRRAVRAGTVGLSGPREATVEAVWATEGGYGGHVTAFRFREVAAGSWQYVGSPLLFDAAALATLAKAAQDAWEKGSEWSNP